MNGTTKTALVSVAKKDGLAKLAKALVHHGYNLVASSGTYHYLKNEGFDAREVSELSGYAYLLGGKVKTLHPAIYTGILSREDSQDKAERESKGFLRFDLVVVQLYQFEEKNSESIPKDELLDYIDIGGVSLIRAAAKNHRRVGVLVDPSQYDEAIKQLEPHGELSLDYKLTLATAAYTRTSQYDSAIAQSFLALLADKPPGSDIQPQSPNERVEPTTESTTEPTTESTMSMHYDMRLIKQQDLRYGENPHQSAALYNSLVTAIDPNSSAIDPNSSAIAPSSSATDPNTSAIKSFDQLYKKIAGKELSYNNILDLCHATSGLRHIVTQCSKTKPAYASVGVKHQNICGASFRPDDSDGLLDLCIKSDPVSIFGGIIACNFEIDSVEARCITSLFLEIVVAPSFTDEALEILKSKKKLILIEHQYENLRPQQILVPVRTTSSYLLQEQNTYILKKENLHCVSKKQTDDGMSSLLLFANAVCSHIKSNAIALAAYKNSAFVLIGAGGGQMNRIQAVQLACDHAQSYHSDLLEGAAMASDAFFPMADSVCYAGDRGVRAVLQPGGSIRDKDSIVECDERGMVMLMTGIRYFLH